MKKQQITIKLESYRPSSTRSCAAAAGRMAREIDLNILAQGHYKKKNQLKITLISGPHVHKKSRDQYKIDRFGAFLVISKEINEVNEVCPEGANRHINKLTANGSDFFKGPAGAHNFVEFGECDKFLEFKNKLYRFNLDEGFSLTFIYSNREMFFI